MSEFDYAAGDLLSCNWDDDGTFRIAKVLATETDGIHLRVYSQRFTTAPRERPAELTLGSFEDDSFGVGHLPLAWRELALWEPRRIGREAVADDELDGYEIWKDAAAEDGAEFFGAARRSLWDRIRGR